MDSSSPPSCHDYALMFLQELRAQGDTRRWRWDAGRQGLVVRDNGLAGSPPTENLFLSNLHQEWLQAPPQARPERLRQAVQSVIERHVPDNVDDARPHLLPLVRNAADRGQGALLADFEHAGIVHRPLCDNLEIQLGYDKPTSIMRVPVAQLAKWGLSIDEAFDIALANLRARSSAGMRELRRGTWASAWNDDHDTARLLLPEVLARHPVRGAPVVMLPSHGRLLLTGDQDADGLALLVRLTIEAQDQPRALSPLMLRLADGRWSAVMPAAHATELRGLRLLADAQAYANQKPLLEERAKRRGEDVFVASCMLAREPDGRPSRSACTWTKDVAALLPRTTWLTFVDLDVGRTSTLIVEWDKALPIVGALMRETDDIPPRYHVTTWPDASQLARLAAVRIPPAAAGAAPPAPSTPAAVRPPRAPRPQPEFRLKSLVMATVCLGLAAVGASGVREIQDTAAAAMAWAGIVVFGVLGLVSGRAFYRGMFPPGP